MDLTGTACRDARAAHTRGLVRIVWTDLAGTAAGCWRAFLSHPFAVAVVADVPAAVEELCACPADLLCVEVNGPASDAVAALASLHSCAAHLPLLVLCRTTPAPQEVADLLQWATSIAVPPLDVAGVRARVLRLSGAAGDSTSAASMESRRRTAPALDLVAMAFPAPVAIEAAAAHCHLSVSQFGRLFRREHGQSFRQFVVGLRIARACEQLERSPTLLKQVGFDVGFNDCAYFSRAFRRRMGVSPRAYRAALCPSAAPPAVRADSSKQSPRSF